MSLTTNELVAAARAAISEVSADQYAMERGDARGDSVLIDVREAAEFGSGHIPGAINIPRGVLEFQVEAHPAMACATDPALALRARPIVLYCRTGGRAALAALSLQQLGFAQVRSLAGGINAWGEGGHPVVMR